LTGATGFIGRFLLAQLLDDTDAIVHCLVRAPSPHAAWSKLKATMQAWDLWNDAFEHRIVAVPGDLRLPRLGMNGTIYRRLAESVDTIYHCGTSMNHLETYAMARLANVESVREIVKFATLERAKLINHISSLGVFSRANGRARTIEETTSIDHERHSVSSGYAASKWVAEKVVMNAAERGVACNIFRLGLAWADSQQGRYDELQREYRVFKSCLLSGYGIRNYQHDPLIPVDHMASAITTLAARHPVGGGTFHLTSPRPMGQGLFERYNEISDDLLELLPLYDWIDAIRRLHLAGQSLPVVPLVEFAFAMDQDALEQHYRRIRPAGVHIECANTWKELEAAGQAVPDFSNEWLRRFVVSLFERDPQLAELTDLRQRLTRRRSGGGPS
jgi:thioester reductase-like protein